MYDKKQEEVINELDRNIILLASAGTGKTLTLSERIVQILRNNKCKAKEILCITFTNKACKEMRERIHKTVGEPANDITIKTLHSFCFDIIKSEAKQSTDIFIDFIIFDEEDTKEIIKKCCYGNFNPPVLQRFINLIKEERIRLDNYSEDEELDYKKTIEYLFEKERKKIEKSCEENFILNLTLLNRVKRDGHKLLKRYNDILHSNHGLDFIDLIDKANEMFKNNDLVNKIRKKYKYINIDEVQDVSKIEYDIFEKLFDGNNVLICGDVFQTIYEWRGSEPSTVLNHFIRNYCPKIIAYNKNYRATKKLTQASINYLNNTYPNMVNKLYKDEIEAKSNIIGEDIEEFKSNNISHEAKYIYKNIRILEESEKLGNACILTRTNKYNSKISNEIKLYIKDDDKFEFILVDQYRFFRRKEIKDVIAFMKLICNRNDSVSLSRILKRLPTGIGEVTLEKIDSLEYRQVGILLSDYIDDSIEIYNDKFGKLIQALYSNCVVVFDVETTGVNVTEDEIIQIVGKKIDCNGNVIDSFEEFIKTNKSASETAHVHGFDDEFLRINGKDKKTTLERFVNFIEGSIIVGHNVSFDINILLSEISRVNLKQPKIEIFFDTLDIYRRFYPNLKNHKLETLSKVFLIENSPDHNAINDVLATKDLLLYAINENIIPTSSKRQNYMKKHRRAFRDIRYLLNQMFIDTELMRPSEIFKYVLYKFNLKEIYKNDEDVLIRYKKLEDFYSLLLELDKDTKNSRDELIDILKLTALSNGDLEELIINNSNKKKIPIITVHQSKGLEYDTVFLAGAHENQFPLYKSIEENNIEEEIRVFYVAITRAKKRLFISYSGKKKSRFIDNIYNHNNKKVIVIENYHNNSKYSNMGVVKLGNSGKKDAIPFIEKYLLSDKMNDKRLAASAINKLCDKFEEECRVYKNILLENLKCDAPQVRQYTLKALSKMVLTFSDFEYLVTIYKKEEKDYNKELIEDIIYSSKVTIK